MPASSKYQLSSPDLTWRDDVTPESKTFGDIYFNPTDGMAESSYVFLEGIGGKEAWADKDCLVVGETGFGTGLNFLTLWQQWDQNKKAGQRLHFMSVEAYPLQVEDMKKALSVWPELSPYIEKLCKAYPQLHPGIHRLTLDGGQVTLTLLFGKAEELFPKVEGKVDAWFLDGFAPSQNESMWCEVVYKEIARLSAPTTRLATFTAAGHVRRGLEAVGFDMQKRPGFGKKRECLNGIFTAPAAHSPDKKAPWFYDKNPKPTGQKIALIGGGIAAFMTAESLQNRRYDCDIFEAAPQAASVGSGNLIGLVQPRLTAADSLDGKFNASAFLHAVRHYSGVTGTENTPIWLAKRGVLQLARTDEEDKRFQRLIAENRLPAQVMRYVSATEASEIAGTKLRYNALYFPDAGCVSPKDFVQEAARKHKNFFPNHQITEIKKIEDHWYLNGIASGQPFSSSPYDMVILANGPYADQVWPEWEIPLHAKRGQVVHYQATEKSLSLNCSIAFEGYISPAAEIDIDGTPAPLHVAGASYANFDQNPAIETPDQTADWRMLRETDRHEIKENVATFLPELDLNEEVPSIKGRAGLRATVPDHLAILGPLPDYDFFEQTYGDLHHGKPIHRYPTGKYHPGLYCLTGLGSRGVQTSPLLAEALADLITGEPCALPKDQLQALHPARFHIRKLKRPPHLRDES